MISKPKIAFLMTQSLESPTGLGRIGPLARELVMNGHPVEIYALHPDFENLQNRIINLEGLQVRYVAPMHVKKMGTLKSYYSPIRLIFISLNAAFKLTQAALSTSAEIIHLSKPHPMNGIAGLAARWLKKKFLITDCDDYEAGSGNFQSGWQQWIVANFEKWIPRRSDFVTTNTTFMKEKLLSWGIPADRILELPNGVESVRFLKPEESRVDALKTSLGLKNRDVVSYIGSLSLASHAVDLLVDSFVKVHELMPEARLLIVGGGEDLEALQSKVSAAGLTDCTLFTGRIQPECIADYYRVSDVTVDPVRNDEAGRGRSPLKLFESWISGTPFITGDLGDRRRILGEPPAGILVPPGDYQALSDAIIRVLSDVKLASVLSERGLERVQMYTWDQLVKRLEPVYQDSFTNSSKIAARDQV